MHAQPLSSGPAVETSAGTSSQSSSSDQRTSNGRESVLHQRELLLTTLLLCDPRRGAWVLSMLYEVSNTHPKATLNTKEDI